MNTLQTTRQAIAARTNPAGLYDRYIAYLDASPKTLESYKKTLRQFVLYIQSQGITTPTRQDLINYRESLKVAGKKPATIQAYITACRLFFQWTASENLYPNIAEHLKGAKIGKDYKKDFLEPAAARKILSSINRSTPAGRRDYALILLMITCGLRTIEASRANIGDLNTLGGHDILHLQGKGHDEKDNFVKLPAETSEALKSYVYGVPYKPRDSKGSEANRPLFVSLSKQNYGQRLSTKTISTIAKSRMIAAGFNSDRLTAHSLRHTAGTLALRNGATLEETQQFLRHDDINSTMKYVHLLNRIENTGGERIAAALFN